LKRGKRGAIQSAVLDGILAEEGDTWSCSVYCTGYPVSAPDDDGAVDGGVGVFHVEDCDQSKFRPADPVQFSSLPPDCDGACDGGVAVVPADDCAQPRLPLWILSKSLPLPLTVTPMVMPPITMLILAIPSTTPMEAMMIMLRTIPIPPMITANPVAPCRWSTPAIDCNCSF
jgi:hypothetical protein